MTNFDIADLTAEERVALADIRRRKGELVDDIDAIRSELSKVNEEMDSLEIVDDQHGKHKAHATGRKKFNQNAKEGIEYMVEQGLLEYTTSDVAAYLFAGECISKAAIGDYLGEKDDFHIQVLAEFVGMHDFADLILVQALREFLWSFRLPGEAQKIDRMMECFAQRYCDCNAGVFRTTDTCYILSFAIIMLNTSLHNPAVKDKPTIEHFISMNRGIDDGEDLPQALLRGLYANILDDEFKMPEEENDMMQTFFNPDRKGWLEKQSADKMSGLSKSWKRRFFLVSDNCLYYFEGETDSKPRSIIPLENVLVRDVAVIDRQRPHAFEIYSNDGDCPYVKACKHDGDKKTVETRHKMYRLAADSKAEKDDWVKSIQAAIKNNPLSAAMQLQRHRTHPNATRGSFAIS